MMGDGSPSGPTPGAAPAERRLDRGVIASWCERLLWKAVSVYALLRFVFSVVVL
jgi:hypothetical protein